MTSLLLSPSTALVVTTLRRAGRGFSLVLVDSRLESWSCGPPHGCRAE